MATFSILEHPLHGPRAVKQGWSWPAFFFGVFWALYKRIWMLAACLFGFIVLSSMLIPATMEGQLISNVLFLGLNLTISLKGNQWYASLLETQGYQYQMQVEARNPNEALARSAEQKAAMAKDAIQGSFRDDDQRTEHDDNDHDNDQNGGGNAGGSKSTGTFVG
ncbi:DUF2628 domain-containing protein [Cobetia sp. L2A1]|uniref:DUF2628 domain-containing protein n=1 Tax=Cobetia sp. L2A1 TaxID=2686360 RepID=UPI00131D50F2|nr:DUF2628 domain-containing protein [Cobetia sp. L2A1]